MNATVVAPPSRASNFKKAMSHGPTRLMFLGGIGLAGIVMVIGFSMMRGGKPSADNSAELQSVPVPTGTVTSAQPVDTAQYEQLTAASNAQAVEQAKATGATAMPIPRVGQAQPEAVAPPVVGPPQPATQDQVQSTAVAADPQAAQQAQQAAAERERALQARYNTMAKQFDLLVARWPRAGERGELATQRIQLAEESPAAVGAVSATNTVVASSDTSTAPTIRANEVFLGVTTSLANTDDAMPLVRARILSGPAKGAELLGTLETSKNAQGAMLRFTMLTPANGGASIAIDAIAVDPTTQRTSVATDVNRHTVSRFSALFFSSVLGGVSEALMKGGQAENVYSTGGTAVVQRDPYSDRQLALIGVGKVGVNGAGMMQSAVTRIPTVTLKGGSEIGVLFLKDLTTF